MRRYTESTGPLLAASSVRVDVDGVAALDGVSLTSTGEWVLLLGAPRALFEAASGLRAIERGTLLVAGVPAIDAVRTGISAGAPMDPPLPPRWSVSDYVRWSARLAGHSGGARAMATEAVERLQLAPYAAVRLGQAPLAIRRGAVLAAALATGAPNVLVEDPTVGLADDVKHSFARAIVGALSDRRVALFAARMPLESPLALAADEAIVTCDAHVVAQGPPAAIAAAERALALRVYGDVPAFIQAFTAQGGLLLAEPPTPSAGIATHVSVNLGPLGTRDLLRIADACDAVVIELRPLACAFA